MPIINDEVCRILSENAKKIAETVKEEMNRGISLRNRIQSVENDYVNECNKEISDWMDFTEDDVIKELNYCVDYFVLMKEGDTIKCDCGTKEMELYFDGKKTVYKDGTGSLSADNIPNKIKNHEEGCFGTCLLEEPSRHPEKKVSDGYVCEPYIVGISWLDTYNNVKIEDLRVALAKQSWLACRYMGRIMSMDAIEEIDTADMTEEEAFEMMLAWIRGEQYIPQVILDKITLIYAGQNRDDFDSLIYNGSESFNNLYKYDAKIIAWSKFVNNLWETEEQKESHLEIRPVLLKALCMQESELGGGEEQFNSRINIAQSLNTGDGGIWQLVNYNPYPNSFLKDGEKNILVWQNKPGSNGDNVTNGYVQFDEVDYFEAKKDDSNNVIKDINGEIIYERVFRIDEKEYFGKADIGENGNSLLLESIKKINKGGVAQEETRIVVYNQQSVDLSLFVGALELANHANTEHQAIINYNGGGTAGYDGEVEQYLIDMGTDFLS